MSMVKTGIVSSKAKKIETDEELEEFEKKAESIRRGMKKNAEKVRHNATQAN